MLKKFRCAIMRVSTELRDPGYELPDRKPVDDSRPIATPDDAHEEPGNVNRRPSAQSGGYDRLELGTSLTRTINTSAIPGSQVSMITPSNCV